MAKMKDSGVEWIGEIPEGWEILRAKNIFRQRNTKGNTVEIHLAATQDNGMYPQHLLDGVVKVKEETNLQEFRTVHKNDFVISLRSFQGGFEKSDYEGVCSPAYQVFYNTSEIDHNYFKKLFKSDGFIAKMNSLTVGIREGKNIQYCDFANSLIPLPPKETQQKIATYLDGKCSQIEQTIQNQQQVIEKLKAYKQSLITEAVTGKVKIQNGKVAGKYEQYKDSGVEWIGEIPSGWNTSKIGMFCYVTKLAGFEFTDIMMDKIVENEAVPIVRAQNVRMFKFNKEIINECIDEETSQTLNRCCLDKKSLLITFIGAGIGDVCIFNEAIRYHLAPNVAKIEIRKFSNDILIEEFLMYYIGSEPGKREIANISKASAQPSLSMETIRKIKLCIPPKEEQKSIAEYLDKTCATIDSAIEQKQKLIEKLTEYKKS
ncbi:restriction endonuclease subunit S, partial [Treponema sp.]|uniref:restriction endonuclease subunit S n=1 Tax=Treponema sp. TaxID=166 RepID=UPI00298D8A67